MSVLRDNGSGPGSRYGTGSMDYRQLPMIQVSPFHDTNFVQENGSMLYNYAFVSPKELPK